VSCAIDEMKTILYYTSNREKSEFEKKIRANILRNSSGLPIISVSQKPINFGKNICVGDVGTSYLNEWRQIIIGAKAAKTKYLVFAESDFLYPEEYFAFVPENEDVYRYDNVWIAFIKHRSYHRKEYSEGAQIVKRNFIIEELEYNLRDMPQWHDGRNIPWPRASQKRRLHSLPYKLFSGTIACVSFKTGHGIRKTTSTIGGRSNRKRVLKHWGHINDLKKEYLEL